MTERYALLFAEFSRAGRRETGDRGYSVDSYAAGLRLACKLLASQEERIEELEHTNRKMLDAAEELSIGAFSQLAVFVTQDPSDPTKIRQLEPSTVQGLYDEFRRKLEELGDWSLVREQKKRIAELAMRLAEAEEDLHCTKCGETPPRLICGKCCNVYVEESAARAKAEEREATLGMLREWLQMETEGSDPWATVKTMIEWIQRRAQGGES